MECVHKIFLLYFRYKKNILDWRKKIKKELEVQCQWQGGRVAMSNVLSNVNGSWSLSSAH